PEARERDAHPAAGPPRAHPRLGPRRRRAAAVRHREGGLVRLREGPRLRHRADARPRRAIRNERRRLAARLRHPRVHVAGGRARGGARGDRTPRRSAFSSLATLLYEGLTGGAPSAGESRVGALRNPPPAPPVPPRQRAREAEITEAAERLILRALAKDPADR